MTLLLLGGTGIAQEIARDLARARAPFVMSVAGGARSVPEGAAAVRIGGFGGEQGFRDYLRQGSISAVLDATHPFATRITARTAGVCAALGLPYALAQRPAWRAGPGDLWVTLQCEEEAADHIETGSTVFLATGRQTLERFANLSDRELICRQIDPPDGEFPFENGRFLVGTPPFSVDKEVALFSELGVDWLVVKNAGGVASASKLAAARALGVRVAMIERPALPDALVMTTAAEALAWVRAL